ncbi:LOW QUALITY PROTEIN: uncharacterized protein LOC125131621, partial [Phacochoerus africanus]|uniref:LOW QUALITY PROTEIN: uncharacterized protein LOC125131621 n=1 Tax=Phacochoerus africanus TaxID=41426 RepID=UPI001FDA590A
HLPAGVLYYYFQGSVGNIAPDHGIVGESSQPIGETLRPVWGRMDKCYPVTAQRRRVKRGKKQGFEVSEAVLEGPGRALAGQTQLMAPRVPGRVAGRLPETHSPTAARAEKGGTSLEKQRPTHSPSVGNREMTRGSEGLSARILPSRPSQQATTPAAAGGLNAAAPKEETGILAQAEGEEATSPIPAGKEVAEEVAVAGTSGWEENKKVPKETAAYTSEASEVDVKEERPGGWVPQLLRTLWPGWFPASEIPKTQNHE